MNKKLGVSACNRQNGERLRYVLVEPPDVPLNTDLVCHAPWADTRSVPLVRARDQEVHDVLHVRGLAFVSVGQIIS